MTPDERESQLSAMYDGELSPAERELVARRLSRDEALRQSWGNYALIGAVMRGEALASADFAPRVAQALARPEVLTAPELEKAEADGQRIPERTPRLPRWAVPASGLGLAAGIAVVGVFSVFWLGSQTPQTVVTGSMVPMATSRVDEVVIPAAPVAQPTPAAETPLAAEVPPQPELLASNGEPMSYVTPPADQQRTNSGLASFNIASYVGAHATVSAPMMRHSAISAIIAADSTNADSTKDESMPSAPPPAPQQAIQETAR